MPWSKAGVEIEIPGAGFYRFFAGARILLARGEFPLRKRHWDARSVRFFPNRMRCANLVERRGRVTLHTLVGAQRLGVHALFVDDDLGAEFTHDGLAAVGRDRHLQHQPVFYRHQIALPAAPDDRVALAHEKAIAGVFDRARVVALGRIVEKRDDSLVAAVGRVEENLTVAARHVHGLQNTKIAGVLDAPAAVARRFAEIDDDFIKPVFRIDLAIDPTHQLFVGAGDGKIVTVGEGLSSRDDKTGKHGWYLHDPLAGLPGLCQAFSRLCQAKP